MEESGIVFDIVEARNLLKRMEEYCTNIKLEMETLINIMEGSTRWRDDQMIVFQESLKVIVKDLYEVLRLESDNLDIYYERVKELHE